MKTLAVFLICLILCVAGSAQTKTCNLSLKDSPVIRNLKLGYSKQQVAQVIDRKNLGGFTFLYAEDLAKLENFDNVSELFIIFNDQNLLDNLVVTYAPSAVQWTDAREFARNLSANLKVPFAYWSFPVEDKTQATISCTDFYIQIYSTLNQVFLKTLDQKSKVVPNSVRNRVERTRQESTFKP